MLPCRSPICRLLAIATNFLDSVEAVVPTASFNRGMWLDPELEALWQSLSIAGAITTLAAIGKGVFFRVYSP